MGNTFSDRYKKLNPKQKEAVDTIYGPVLVIAGPGSGKTELLAIRIANILRKTDAHPSNILCLTFTDNAARNMRERLRGIIGQDAYRVAIHTFHTFGIEILNRFRHHIREDEDLNPIDDIESSRIFHEMIHDLPWDHPWKRKSRLGILRNTIKYLKEAGISAIDLKNILSINDHILNRIRPLIEEAHIFFSLGQKREEKIEKVRRFKEFSQKVISTLNGLGSEASESFHTKKTIFHYGLHETLAPVLIQGLEETLAQIDGETDTKPITTWRNTWLEKQKDVYFLKDEDKQKESLALLSLYEGYESRLHERSLIDFSDMILRAITLVENDTLIRAILSEQYQWIMIDEYQDTNDAQLRLITSMLTQSVESPNIFAVGDDDQSIYKFQGANTRNIRLFRDLYADTHLIILEENYRSLSNIIDISRQIMNASNTGLEQIFPGQKKSYHASRGRGGEKEMRIFPTQIEEFVWVANDIEKKVREGVQPEEIAVITKKNDTLEYIAKLLLTKRIPVYLSKEENIFSDEVISLLVSCLQYIDALAGGSQNEGTHNLLVTILAHPMWRIHRLTLWEISRKISRAKKDENQEWIEVLRKNKDRNISIIAHFFIELSLRSHTERLETLIDLITGANSVTLPDEYTDESDRNQLTLEIDGESRVYTSPFFEYYFSKDKLTENPSCYARHLTNVRKIIESVRSYRKSEGRLTLKDFAIYMNLIDEYDISLTSSSLLGNKNAVQCITAHKAKGLEYSHVYAIGLTEKQYKGSKKTSSPLPKNLPLAPENDNDEDIRRLVYTVMTRAKDRLVLSYAEKSIHEKGDTLIGTLAPLEEHEWIRTDIEPEMSDIEILLATEYHDLFMLPFTAEEQGFLTSLLDSHFSLSATALQNFLDVTSGGPKNFLSNNVLRFPQAKSPSASYGTAMHKALEDFFHYYKIYHHYRESILRESFEKRLQEDGLDEITERDLLNRGKTNLQKLYAKISNESHGELHLEYRFVDGGGVWFERENKDISRSDTGMNSTQSIAPESDNLLGTRNHPRTKSAQNMTESLRLTGVIDCIEITPDGRLIITDYKTGEGFSSLEGGSGYEAIKKWKYRLQLTFYALLFSLSPRWSPWKNREYRLFFIEPDSKTEEFYEVKEYIQLGEIDRLKNIISIVIKKIRNLDFPDVSGYEESVKGIRQFEEDLLDGKI